jgi:hypothetical protein
MSHSPVGPTVVTGGVAHQRRSMRLGGHAEVSCVCGWGVEVHGRSGDDTSRLVDKAFCDHVTLPVLSLWQPWATLVAILAKIFETRAYPPPDRFIGARIAIQAARNTAALKAGARIGRFKVRLGCDGVQGSWELVDESCDGSVWPLPLGAIVATTTLGAGLPIVGVDDPTLRSHIRPSGHLPDRLFLVRPTIAGHDTGGVIDQHNSFDLDDITEQRPYGDYSAGRFGWPLIDTVVVDPPPPFVGGQGWTKRWQPT